MFSRAFQRFSLNMRNPVVSRLMSTTKDASNSLWQKYNHQLIENPILTKSITAGLLATAADVVCQIYFPLDPEEKKKPAMERVNWKRTFNFAVINTLFVPPLMHHWYGMLSVKIVGETFLAAVKRVFLDQSLFAPFMVSFFFAANLLMDNRIEELPEKLKVDFLPTLLANYSVWIPAQLINFKFIAPQLRVLWANFIGFFWSIYLSNATNKTNKPSDEKDKEL